MSVDKSVIARLKLKNQTFEIFVNLEKAIAFREGKIKNVLEVLEVDEIFKDAKKGERASESSLIDVFGTSDIEKVAEIIIKKGEIPLTTEYRRKIIEMKRKQVIETIRRIAIDPRTKLPFTPQRVEEMINQVKINIDPFKSVEDIVDDVIKQLRKKFPIKVEYIKVKVFIPYEQTAAVNIIKKKYKILREEWGEDGWIGLLELPAGVVSEFYSELGKITKGKGYAEEFKN